MERQLNRSGVILGHTLVPVGDLSASRDIELIVSAPWQVAVLMQVTFCVQKTVKQDILNNWTAQIVYLKPTTREEILIGSSISSADFAWAANSGQTLDGDEYEIDQYGGVTLRMTKNTPGAPTLEKLAAEYVLWKGALPED